MDAAQQAVLLKYGLNADAPLYSGVEAEVYARGPDALLKLYPGAGRLADLCALQDFYAGLERGVLSYELPSIQQVSVEGDFCVSIERRLPGVPMGALLRGLDRTQTDALLETYLSAALELSRLPLPADAQRYLLFDPFRLSLRQDGDFHQFLARFINHRLAQLAPHLGRDVTDFEDKARRMQAVLAQPYLGSLRVVHGDFYPGNLLVDETWRVTALLDFGLMTMLGDPLFDLATACVFFDMYDELKANLRERLFSIALERLGAQARGKLVRYVLIYSLLSANTYSAACADGHYRWCVDNLNNAAYWDGIE